MTARANTTWMAGYAGSYQLAQSAQTRNFFYVICLDSYLNKRGKRQAWKKARMLPLILRIDRSVLVFCD